MKVILFALLILTGCKAPDVSSLNPLDSYLNPQTKDDDSIRDEYMDLVNAYRGEVGVDALIYSGVIEQVAQEHSENMAKGEVPFGHEGSGVRCQKLMTEIGPANLCGEIVAQGQDNAKEVFSAWMSSLSHRSKIENGRYTHTGLGIARNPKGTIYWTQIYLEVL